MTVANTEAKAKRKASIRIKGSQAWRAFQKYTSWDPPQISPTGISEIQTQYQNFFTRFPGDFL